MNTLKLTFTLLPAIIIALISSPNLISGEADSIIYENDSIFTIESYQEELSKDGEWIKVDKDEIDPEGVTDAAEGVDDDINTDYVWRPYGVEPDWSPYSNGYWVYTNCGWMWMSYYHWGWRTCHYGRWWWSPRWGWVWSPGFVWAPSWVVWMFYDGYCGWYPISPRIRWHHRHHRWYCNHMRFRVRHWTVCHSNNFTGPITPQVIIDPPGIKEVFTKGKFYTEVSVENNEVVNRGPDVGDVEKYGGKKKKTEDVTKYNNVKVLSDPGEKYNEKKQVNEKKKDDGTNNNGEVNKNNEKYRNDNENKNTEKRSNDNGQKNNEKYKNDNGNKDNEKKSNDNGNVKKYDQPREKQKDSYDPPREKQKENYNPPKEEKKQDYSPPKDDNKNNNRDNSGKQDTRGNNDNENNNDNNNGQKKGR